MMIVLSLCEAIYFLIKGKEYIASHNENFVKNSLPYYFTLNIKKYMGILQLLCKNKLLLSDENMANNILYKKIVLIIYFYI